MSEIEKSVSKSQDKLDIQEEEKQRLAEDVDVPPTDPPDPPPGEEAAGEAAKEGGEEAKEGEEAAEETKAKEKSGLKKGLSNIKNKIPPIFSRSKSKDRKEKKGDDGGENEEDKKLLQGEEVPPMSPTKTEEGEAEVEDEEDKAEKPVAKSWSKEVLAKIPKVKMPSNPFKKSNKGCEPVELKETGDKDIEAGEETAAEEEKKEGEGAEGGEETKEEQEPKPAPVSRTTQLLKAIRAPLVAVWPKRNKVE